MSTPLLVFLLVCFSVHACEARFLGLISHAEITRMKDMEKLDLSALEVNSIGSLGATNKMNQKDMQALSNLKEIPTKGNEHIIVSSHKDLPQKIKIEELKSEGRSMLGSGDVEEAEESKEKDVTEDIEVMDYAQPHRKPPIHNQKS